MNQFASIFVLAVVVLVAAWYTIDRICATTTPGTPREYEASAYGPKHRFRTDLCMVTNCGQTHRHDLGNGWLVCTDCRDEMEAGWAREQAPFNQELADLDKIERYANGGDAA